MTIKGLLTHFDNENKLTIKESNYDRIEWEGIAKDLKNGSEFTYASCKVKNWYVKDNGTIIVSIEE
jgi:hypothetical protein